GGGGAGRVAGGAPARRPVARESRPPAATRSCRRPGPPAGWEGRHSGLGRRRLRGPNARVRDGGRRPGERPRRDRDAWPPVFLPPGRGGVAAPSGSGGPLTPRVLVAGVGNVFRGDDAFGVEVARRLADRSLLPGVRVIDFGIRGLDLAYAMLDGYDVVILVDAAPRGGSPGTLYDLEPQTAPGVPVPAGLALDAHG